MISEKMSQIKEQRFPTEQQAGAEPGFVTIINDTPYDVEIMMVTMVLPISCGYVKAGKQGNFPTTYAGALDVFALFQAADSLVLAEWNLTGWTIRYNRKKHWVKPGMTLRVSEMESSDTNDKE